MKIKRVLFTATFISILACSCMVATLLLDVGKANPYFYVQEEEEVPPPSNVTPPTITISSPENNTVYGVSNFSLVFNVRAIVPNFPVRFYCYLGFSDVYYEASWLSNRTTLDVETTRYYENCALNHKFSISLEGVPEGYHSLKVSAVLNGSRQTNVTSDAYGTPVIRYGTYKVVGSSLVNFTVDTTAPKVSILTLENKTYNTPDVMLNCTVDERVSQVAYSLDGQSNVTISRNTILADLSIGEHNVTVYATDLAGHVGVSETIFFNIAEPFPTTLVIVPIASVAIVGIGMLVYFKKRKH